MLTASTVAIGTLRLTGAPEDSPVVRLRAAAELSAAALVPPGLPPAAVLLVRRLRDPQPGCFGSRADHRPHPTWERAVRERLGDAARLAARPDHRGELPAEAEAVLFADTAELVAGLVRRQVAGGLGERWWARAGWRWLGLGRATPYDRDPAPLLAARPREAAAALALLSRWGEAPAVARALSPAGARQVLAALLTEHGLPAELAGPGGSPVLYPTFVPGDGATTLPTDVSSPWRSWLPAALRDGELPAAVEALFGVSLALATAGERLRAPALARQAAAWWAQVETDGRGRRAEPMSAPMKPVFGTTPVTTTDPDRSPAAHPTEEPAPQAAIEPGEPSGAPESARRDVAPPTADASSSPGGVPESSPELGSPAAPRVTRPSEASPAAAGEPQPAAAPDASAAPPPAPAPASPHEEAGALARATSEPLADHPASEPARAADPAAEDAIVEPFALGTSAIATRLGGVLYLIHLLGDFDLPAAAEEEWQLASTLGPWGTLDLVARGLLAPCWGEVADDPLWTVLDGLAGRAGRAEGRTAGTGPAATSQARAKGSTEEAPPTHVAAGPVPAVLPDPAVLRVPAVPVASQPRAEAWLATALPALRERLLLALNVDPADRTAGDAALWSLLAVPGRLYVTSSHLDLVIPLDRIDLTVRRAGLDRDPGWLPAWGRVVLFHFE